MSDEPKLWSADEICASGSREKAWDMVTENHVEIRATTLREVRDALTEVQPTAFAEDMGGNPFTEFLAILAWFHKGGKFEVKE